MSGLAPQGTPQGPAALSHPPLPRSRPMGTAAPRRTQHGAGVLGPMLCGGMQVLPDPRGSLTPALKWDLKNSD